MYRHRIEVVERQRAPSKKKEEEHQRASRENEAKCIFFSEKKRHVLIVYTFTGSHESK